MRTKTKGNNTFPFEGSRISVIMNDNSIIEGDCVLYGKEEIHLLNPRGGKRIRTRYMVIMKKDVKIVYLKEKTRNNPDYF